MPSVGEVDDGRFWGEVALGFGRLGVPPGLLFTFLNLDNWTLIPLVEIWNTGLDLAFLAGDLIVLEISPSAFLGVSG